MKMVTCFVQIAAGGLLPLLLVSQVSGSIISGTVTGTTANTAGSVFQLLVPPVAVGGNADFLGKNVYGLNEKAGVTLGSSLAVEGGTLAAGTVVDSHLVFANLSGTGAVSATIKFTQQVLGVIFRSNPNPDLLTPSNALFGLAGVTYNGSAANAWGIEQGYMFAGFTEGVSINFDEITFTAAGLNVDSVRVLTSAPEPGAMAALGLASVAFVAGVRRRRNSAAVSE